MKPSNPTIRSIESMLDDFWIKINAGSYIPSLDDPSRLILALPMDGISFNLRENKSNGSFIVTPICEAIAKLLLKQEGLNENIALVCALAIGQLYYKNRIKYSSQTLQDIFELDLEFGPSQTKDMLLLTSRYLVDRDLDLPQPNPELFFLEATEDILMWPKRKDPYPRGDFFRWRNRGLLDLAKQAIKNPALSERRLNLGSFGNVFKIDAPGLEGLVFKVGGSEELNAELKKTRGIFNAGEGFEFSEPLGFVSGNNQDYIVFREIGGGSITYTTALAQIKQFIGECEPLMRGAWWWNHETVCGLAKRTLMLKAIKALVKMQHSFATSAETPYPGLLPDYDYRQELQAKLRGRLAIPFIEKVTPLCIYLDSMPRSMAHGDMHTDNLMISQDGETCLIDFEKACYANQFYDLAFLLEQAKLGLNDEEKKKFVGYFVEQLKAKGIKCGQDPDTAYRYNAAFVNLMAAGGYANTSGRYYDNGVSKSHLERAIQIMNRIVPQ